MAERRGGDFIQHFLTNIESGMKAPAAKDFLLRLKNIRSFYKDDLANIFKLIQHLEKEPDCNA